MEDNNCNENIVKWTPQNVDNAFIKEAIRKRVRNSHVGDNATFIPAKPVPSVYDGKFKKVAVYTRVSTSSKEQVSSIENQTKYYTEKINNDPNLSLKNIYCDEGKSGVSIKKRQGFNNMIADAKRGDVDVIFCASVSRFARNLQDCLEQITALKISNPKHPVGVFFETENIYTLNPDSDEALMIHAMLADWESKNKSRRMLLSYDQRICTGQYPVADLLGYRHTIDGNLIIQEEEAKTVKFIFLAYACGYSTKEIAEILTQKERPTLKGRTDWNAGMVSNIMKNERRWGDLSVRKTIVLDYKTGKIVKNDRIRDAAFVSQHHTGIVSPEIAKAVQFLSKSNNKISGGISELSVIKEGTLKGFISVSPYWSAINKEIFYNLSKNVYNNEELSYIQKETSIRSGETHNNFVSMILNDYEIPHSACFISPSTLNITINPKQIKFNKKCYEKLDCCKFVEILYHPILHSIVLREADEKTPNSFSWNNKKGIFNGKISADIFSNIIYESKCWKKEYSYKFRGVSRKRGNYKILVFFLDEPQINPYKSSKKTTQNNLLETGKYVDYQTNNELYASYYKTIEKQENFSQTLTEKDILNKGNIVDNPMIGKIPKKEDIKYELQELLATM